VSEPLPAERLYRRADLAELRFKTTADLEPIDGLIGQRRAGDALALGTRIGARGFNVFAIGSPGARMQRSIRELLEREARDRPPPSDWVYVNNFSQPHKPVAIALPCGRAVVFQKAMRGLIDDLKSAIPAVFESDDYQRRRGAIEEATRGKGEAAFNALNEKAVEKGVVILRTPNGFAMAPAKNGEVVPPEQVNAWPEAERRALQETMKALEAELEQTVRSIPHLEKERRDAVRKLDQETTRFAIGQTLEDTKARFHDLPKVVEHLETIRADLVENVYLFVNPQAMAADEAAKSSRAGSPFDRYEVNVLVTHAEDCPAAPVIEEPHPTLGNLLGRIEHITDQGVLITNFRLIRAGALHRANGGAILLDVRNLLTEAGSWPALKRALSQQAIEIEDLSRFLGLASTVTLEPDPIPLDVKVVLVGDRLLYYMLAQADPDLLQHFKVLADFDDDIDRAPATEATLARVIASLVREEKLRPFERSAVARTVEQAARLADDAGKLTLAVEEIRDLVVEASFWADDAKRAVVTAADVNKAIDQQMARAARLRERTKEMVLRDIALIATSGSHVGQINGLSVFMLGGHPFGRPARITCRVRPGAGRIIDIEREVDLGGPLHSKGVLILSGFLAGRYALDAPMSLSASLVFEQSYSGVDGDSASSAELYAILSALAEAPLRQDFAVTGSVNQYGEVQAIGGVNEKIEGFFEICKARGLTGTQGVLIPASNVQHLMLREEVVDACRAGQFSIWPVRTIDEGLEILTGQKVAEINEAVKKKLYEFAETRRKFAGPESEAGNERASGKPTPHP
jgi:lon-related putative ATP-dependent protease